MIAADIARVRGIAGLYDAEDSGFSDDDILNGAAYVRGAYDAGVYQPAADGAVAVEALRRLLARGATDDNRRASIRQRIREILKNPIGPQVSPGAAPDIPQAGGAVSGGAAGLGTSLADANAIMYRNAAVAPDLPTGIAYDGRRFTLPSGWSLTPTEPAVGSERWGARVRAIWQGAAWGIELFGPAFQDTNNGLGVQYSADGGSGWSTSATPRNYMRIWDGAANAWGGIIPLVEGLAEVVIARQINGQTQSRNAQAVHTVDFAPGEFRQFRFQVERRRWSSGHGDVLGTCSAVIDVDTLWDAVVVATDAQFRTGAQIDRLLVDNRALRLHYAEQLDIWTGGNTSRDRTIGLTFRRRSNDGRVTHAILHTPTRTYAGLTVSIYGVK